MPAPAELVPAPAEKEATEQSRIAPVGEAMALAGQVQAAQKILAEAGIPHPRLGLKVPVAEHRERLNTAEKIYVATAPLTDESVTETIVA